MHPDHNQSRKIKQLLSLWRFYATAVEPTLSLSKIPEKIQSLYKKSTSLIIQYPNSTYGRSSISGVTSISGTGASEMYLIFFITPRKSNHSENNFWADFRNLNFSRG
jgi:hypothetical protein